MRSRGQPKPLLSAAVTNGEHEAVRQHAHALSGAAGTLAVEELRAAAAVLEAAGRAHQGGLVALFAIVEYEARRFLGSLVPLQIPLSPAPGRTPRAAEFAQLSHCLAQGELSAINAELAKFDSAGGDALAQLRVLIGDYDYERAAALIAELP